MGTPEVFERISIDKIKTGDVLFFSNNTPTGLALRTFTSTLWSHTGIAIRIIIRGKRQRLKVSTTEEGELYIMEINARERYDRWTNSERRGFGISTVDYVLDNQTIAAVRTLKDELRTPELSRRTKKFIKKFGSAQFPDYFKPFLGAWLGYPVDRLSVKKNESGNIELFCSEMMAYYYIYSIIPIANVVLRGNIETNTLPLQFILGSKCPHRPDIIAPRHFEPHNSPDSKIFSDSIKVFSRKPDDVGKTLMFPIITGVMLGIVIWSCLPGNSWAETSRSSNYSTLPKAKKTK